MIQMKFTENKKVRQGSIVLIEVADGNGGTKIRPAVVTSSGKLMNKNIEDAYFSVTPMYTLHDDTKVSHYATHIPVKMSDMFNFRDKSYRGNHDEYGYLALEQTIGMTGRDIKGVVGCIDRYGNYKMQINSTIRAMYGA